MLDCFILACLLILVWFALRAMIHALYLAAIAVDAAAFLAYHSIQLAVHLLVMFTETVLCLFFQMAATALDLLTVTILHYRRGHS